MDRVKKIHGSQEVVPTPRTEEAESGNGVIRTLRAGAKEEELPGRNSSHKRTAPLPEVGELEKQPNKKSPDLPLLLSF